MANVNNKTLVGLVVVAVCAVIIYGILTMPDERTTSQRVGDAIEALPDADEAARQLEQRTPGEKLGDAVQDVGKDIERNTDNQ